MCKFEMIDPSFKFMLIIDTAGSTLPWQVTDISTTSQTPRLFDVIILSGIQEWLSGNTFLVGSSLRWWRRWIQDTHRMLHEPLQLVERGSVVVIINTATPDELKPCPGKLNNYHQGFIERTCCPVEDGSQTSLFFTGRNGQKDNSFASRSYRTAGIFTYF
jgi:hypothetical protein